MQGRRNAGHASGDEYRASCTNILPEAVPVFAFDYKQKNNRQVKRGHCEFINTEIIEANVIVGIKISD